MAGFIVSVEDQNKIDAWLKTKVYPPIIERQRREAAAGERLSSHEWLWDKGYPYEGACGGGLTYEFTPTSIGTIFKVRYKTFNEDVELDLTDYESF